MTFFLSKFLWLIISPLNIILIVNIFVIIFFFINKFISKTLFILNLVFLLFFGTLPIGQFLMQKLVNKFYELETLPDFVDGILILSGSENPFLTKVHNQVNLNESSERLIESMKLINKYPQAKIVFSGCYKIKDDDICSSEVVMKLFIQNNISINNIT